MVVVFVQPVVKIGLKFFKRLVDPLSKCDLVKLLKDCLVETFAGAVCLRTFRLCFRVIYILKSQVELILMLVFLSAVFGAAVCLDSKQWNVLLVEEWNDTIV